MTVRGETKNGVERDQERYETKLGEKTKGGEQKVNYKEESE